MTRLFLPCLVVLSVMFFSCSSGKNPPSTKEGLIVLKGEVAKVIDDTRAPVLPGKFTAQVLSSKTSDDFTALFDNFDLALTFEADKSTTITPPRYYPEDKSTVYIKGFAPTSGTRSANTITFNIDGQQDILLSNAVSGSEKTPITTTLLFQHKLVQFNVSIKADGAGVALVWGDVTVKAINEDKKISLDFISGVLTGAEPGEILAGTKPIAGGETAIGTIMVRPLGESVHHELFISGTLNPTGTTIMLDNIATAAGKSYNIVVTLFSSGECTFTATEAEWKDGGNTIINPN